MDKRKITIALILLVQFVVTFEMNVVMPLAPHIASIYGVAPYQITYLNIGYSLLGMLAPIIGYQSDKLGLKKMTIFTLSLFFCGSFLVSKVDSSIAYIVGRGLMGITFSTMMAIGISFLGILVPKEKFGFISGLYRVAFGLAVFSAPLIGTYIVAERGFQFIYTILSVTMLVLIVLFAIISPNTKTSNHSISIKAINESLFGKNEKKLVLITFLMTLPAIFFFSYLSVHLSQQNFSPNNIAMVYTMVALGSILGGVSITLLSDRMGKQKMLVRFATLIPFAALAFYFSSGTWVFIFGLIFGFLFDVSSGLIFPIGSKVVRNYKSTYLTLLSLTMAFSTVMSNIIGPTLYSFGGFLILIVMIAFGIGLASILLRTLQIYQDN